MKLTIEVEISDKDRIQVLQNSLERVMNNAIFVGQCCEKIKNSMVAERSSTLWQDCEELKDLTCKLWDALRNKVYEDALISRYNNDIDNGK